MSALLNTTNEAEGLPRRRFTVAELERMVEAGLLQEDERIELIGGEIVPMSPKGDVIEHLRRHDGRGRVRSGLSGSVINEVTCTDRADMALLRLASDIRSVTWPAI